MITKLKINPTSGKLDLVGVIPQLDADPSSPNSEDAWVLKTTTVEANTGSPVGLLLAITHPETYSYQFSYRTIAGNTLRVALT